MRRSGIEWTSSALELLPDAETRKYPPQQVITGELTSDFAERLLGATELLGNQLAGTALLQLALGFIDIAAGTAQRIEVSLASGHSAGIDCLIAHALLEMGTERIHPYAGRG